MQMEASNLNNEMEYCEMHCCLRISMKLSRWAGMFPVEGLNKIDIRELRFNIKSFYTLYYLTTIILQTVITGFMTHWFLINDLTLSTLSNLVFYITGLTSAVLLLKLARDWPKLIHRATVLERRCSPIRFTKINVTKFNTLTYAVLISAAVEHSLSIINRAKNIVLCREILGNSKESFLENYYFHTFPFVFKYVPCNYLTIILCAFANLQATFLWNFTDVMTMCFSMYLTSYFQDLNKLVKSEKNKIVRNWEQIRIYYSKLVALVQAVDSRICFLILLSILTNLFFICLQLFNTLNFGFIYIANCTRLLQQNRRTIDRVIILFYYSYSFSFLVIRATIMLFLAANVNTVAIEPKYELSNVSSADYSIHVQRFNRQLRYTTTALSGVFFYVTRRMILRVLATIITYELVLLQFNKL